MLTPSATPPTLKIGIYRSTSIGDVVLATACMDLLARLGAPCEVTWIGRQPALQLIQSAFPHLRCLEVHSHPEASETARLREALSGLHFIVDLQTSLRSRMICRGIKKDFKVPYYSCDKNTFARSRWVLSSRVMGRLQKPNPKMQVNDAPQYLLMANTLRHALSQHLPVEMLDAIADYQPTPILPNHHDEGQRPWQKELRFGRWLAVAPGAAHLPKQAPLDVLLRILTRLRRQLKGVAGEESLGLVFLGNENDRELSLNVLDQLAWPHATLNLAGKLSLWESALALKETKAVLTNDSSLAHIAEAVGTPSLTLFGPTIEAFGFTPWRPESRAFSVLLGCRPCSKHGKAPCRYGDYMCFKSLNENHIADHVIQLVLADKEPVR